MSTPQLHCDFCDSDRVASWVYPSHAIDIPDTAAHSEADWAACEDCHRLLAAEDRTGLLDHAARVLARKWESVLAEAELRPGIEKMHAKYWEARIPGPAKPIHAHH